MAAIDGLAIRSWVSQVELEIALDINSVQVRTNLIFHPKLNDY